MGTDEINYLTCTYTIKNNLRTRMFLFPSFIYDADFGGTGL